MPSLPRLLLPLAALGLLAGCSTTQYPRGTGFLITPLYSSNTRRDVYLGVDGSHLLGRPADGRVGFDLELQQDGCTRGDVGGNQVEVCSAQGERGDSDSAKSFRVNGPLGSRTFTLEQRDDRVFVDFGINQGRAQFVVPDGFLRQHPEMVAAAWFYGAFGLPRPGSDTQAYLIEPRRS
jgi:hypothetical protein